MKCSISGKGGRVAIAGWVVMRYHWGTASLGAVLITIARPLDFALGAFVNINPKSLRGIYSIPLKRVYLLTFPRLSKPSRDQLFIPKCMTTVRFPLTHPPLFRSADPD